MSKRLLYVYKWATAGGVERVILNRALAFKERGERIRQDIYFFHDSGGVRLLEMAIREAGLETTLSIVDACEPDQYDWVCAIDTPEILKMTERYDHIFLECHTAYQDNRSYLGKLPDTLGGVIAPSQHFADTIASELPLSLRSRLYVFPNAVPTPKEEGERTPMWAKTPLVSIGRVDSFKNTKEIVDVFELARKRMGDAFMLTVVGPVAGDYDLHADIQKRGLTARFLSLPPMPFHRVDRFLSLVKANRGVFLSASKGESFGLSVIEAMKAGVPVLLSDPHADIVPHPSYLYPIGRPDLAVDRLEAILGRYDEVSAAVRRTGGRYGNDAFLRAWDAFKNDQGTTKRATMSKTNPRSDA